VPQPLYCMGMYPQHRCYLSAKTLHVSSTCAHSSSVAVYGDLPRRQSARQVVHSISLSTVMFGSNFTGNDKHHLAPCWCFYK